MIDHLRASRVVGTWLLARQLPGDIGRSAGDAVVPQLRSQGRQGAAKRQSVSSGRLGNRTARASNGLALGLIRVLALFGPHEMSDLSPECAPKRTSVDHQRTSNDPKGGWEVDSGCLGR